MSRDVLVVGAGMAGLTVAAARVAAGDRVTVLDKGRRHGGRMATRRVDGVAYDTGVPSFAVRSPTMRAVVDAWTAAGHAAEVPEEPGRFRGTPTMRSLPTALGDAAGAEVRLATTVTGLRVRDGRWAVEAEEGGDVSSPTILSADVLVMTAPAPQTLALLRAAGPDHVLAAPSTLAQLETVTYEPCLAVLVRSSDASVPPHTILADASASVAHLDGDRVAAAEAIAADASARLGVNLAVVHVHGWRYARVDTGADGPALRDDTAGAPLVIAGDLFDPSEDAAGDIRAEGVERAFLSAHAAAALLDRE